MDYAIKNSDGEMIIIEEYNTSERLGAYFNLLLQHNNPSEDLQTKKVIDYVINSMDESEQSVLEQKIRKKDSTYEETISINDDKKYPKHLKEYVNRIVELTNDQKEIVAPMQEIVDTYKGFDFDSIIEEEINGNVFTYTKDKFPIEKYRQELEEFGKKSKGNRWSVSLTNDGRLVIY